jgi:hypothetical protein
VAPAPLYAPAGHGEHASSVLLLEENSPAGHSAHPTSTDSPSAVASPVTANEPALHTCIVSQAVAPAALFEK